MPEENQMPNNGQSKNPLTMIIIVVIIIGIAIIGYLAMSNKNANVSDDNKLIEQSPGIQQNENNNPQTVNSSLLGQANQNLNINQDSNLNQNNNLNLQENETPEKTFTITGKNFSFTPSEIRVAKGDKVKIIFQNDEGFHDWVIDEFNAKTPQIPAGQTATVEFIADITGQFEFYCSVGQHRQLGMKGILFVN